MIIEECDSVKNLLLEKNKSYGDSAVKPIAVFGNADPIISIGARIDDKLSRIKNKGINDETEDTVSDLIGYLILLKVTQRMQK